MSVKIIDNSKKIAAEFQRDASRVVKGTTFRILAGTQQRAPVDTGQLRASYEAEFPDELTGVVGSGVLHSIFQEFGTAHQSGTPHLIPACEAEKDNFLRDLKAIGK